MPELPDLQVFSKNLTKIFVGKKIDESNDPEFEEAQRFAERNAGGS